MKTDNFSGHSKTHFSNAEAQKSHLKIKRIN